MRYIYMTRPLYGNIPHSQKVPPPKKSLKIPSSQKVPPPKSKMAVLYRIYREHGDLALPIELPITTGLYASGH